MGKCPYSFYKYIIKKLGWNVMHSIIYIKLLQSKIYMVKSQCNEKKYLGNDHQWLLKIHQAKAWWEIYNGWIKLTDNTWIHWSTFTPRRQPTIHYMSWRNAVRNTICMKNSPNHHHHQNQLSPRSTYQFKRIFTKEKHINHHQSDAINKIQNVGNSKETTQFLQQRNWKKKRRKQPHIKIRKRHINQMKCRPHLGSDLNKPTIKIFMKQMGTHEHSQIFTIKEMLNF